MYISNIIKDQTYLDYCHYLEKLRYPKIKPEVKEFLKMKFDALPIKGKVLFFCSDIDIAQLYFSIDDKEKRRFWLNEEDRRWQRMEKRLKKILVNDGVKNNRDLFDKPEELKYVDVGHKICKDMVNAFKRIKLNTEQPEIIQLNNKINESIEPTEIEGETNRIRILYGLGIIDHLNEKYKEANNGLESENQIAQILIDLGITESKKQSTIQGILAKLRNKKVDMKQDYIDNKLRQMNLLK